MRYERHGGLAGLRRLRASGGSGIWSTNHTNHTNMAKRDPSEKHVRRVRVVCVVRGQTIEDAASRAFRTGLNPSNSLFSGTSEQDQEGPGPQMTLRFKVETTPDDNGSLLVTVPALPEVTTFADTLEEAHVRACDAVGEALAARISAGVDLPPGDSDGTVAVPLLTELKAELYTAARARAVSRAELARRLGWNRESVDRLFRLDHLSRLSQIEDAYGALGLTLGVQAIEIA